jgi:hypothetical protein
MDILPARSLRVDRRQVCMNIGLAGNFLSCFKRLNLETAVDRLPPLENPLDR